METARSQGANCAPGGQKAGDRWRSSLLQEMGKGQKQRAAGLKAHGEVCAKSLRGDRCLADGLSAPTEIGPARFAWRRFSRTMRPLRSRDSRCCRAMRL